MAEDRLRYLFERHLAKTCTALEKEELASLILEAGNDSLVKELVGESWELTGTDKDMAEDKAVQMLEDIVGRDNDLPKKGRVVPMHWWRMVAAASILLVIAIGGYLLFYNQKRVSPNVEQVADELDVKAPHLTKARIILEDGRSVSLDSISSGILAMQGDAKVTKNDGGEIRYNSDSRSIATNTPVVYNTLFNPRGSRVAVIVLADGTKVWLNAESSLKYFSTVGKDERRVEVTGEAYFEVAKDPGKKFIVKTNGASVEVLGTHFNVNTYQNEGNEKITLLEGSLKVHKDNSAALLKPGQQAAVTNSISVTDKVNVEAVMAWKNGVFNFQDRQLGQILKEVARWYDIDVVYMHEVPDMEFFGEIGRDADLSQILHFLKRTGVKFEVDAKKKRLIIQ